MNNTHHLTLQDRQSIQDFIAQGKTKADMGRLLGKDPSGIAREIRRHREFKARNAYNRPVLCENRSKCRKGCRKPCDEYREPTCKRRDISPGACMAASIDHYQQLLGLKRFREVLPLLLADRGAEFEIFKLFEKDPNGEDRLRIFYCDPMQSSQKPHVENNHNFVRDVIPNGRSMVGLTQDDIDLMFSHINSTPRKSMKGRTPFEAFCFYYGHDLAELFGVRHVAPDDVVLKPSLIFSKYTGERYDWQ